MDWRNQAGIVLRYVPTLFLVLSVILTGCETVTDPGDIPYVERLVVEATLQDGEPIRSIRIARTMPLDVPYNRDSATVRNVTGFIEVEGERHALQFDAANGVYTVPLTATRGKEYSLTAEWNGRKVTARTRVPHPPTIVSVEADTMAENFYDPTVLFYTNVRIVFIPHDTRAVYGIGIRSLVDGEMRTLANIGYGDPIFRLRDTNDQGRIEYKHGRDDFGYGMMGGRGTTVATVYAFDEPFFDYYSSRYRSDDFSFSQEEDIHWNVEGDGIGLFIGRSRADADFPY